jgi:hypothetical protein
MGIPRQPREPVRTLDFVGGNWILPREHLGFIGWKQRFLKMESQNAEGTGNVKQQSLVNHPVRFTEGTTRFG